MSAAGPLRSVHGETADHVDSKLFDVRAVSRLSVCVFVGHEVTVPLDRDSGVASLNSAREAVKP
jgi:hypothetical protein